MVGAGGSDGLAAGPLSVLDYGLQFRPYLVGCPRRINGRQQATFPVEIQQRFDRWMSCRGDRI